MIKQHTIAAAMLLVSATAVQAQTYDWGGRFGGTGEDVIRKLYVTPSGDAYTTGYFTDTANFAVNGNPQNSISNGFYDVFVQKTDVDGQLVWARSFGSSSFEYGTGIVSDADGNVYVTGVFDSPIDFDPGPGSNLLSSNGEQDIFLVKYDVQGNFLWARNIGGNTYDESTALGVDENGNVYLSGYFNGTADFDPGAGTFEFTGLGANDNFIAKYTSDGDFIWAKHYGSSNFEAALSMRVKGNGAIYITGFFNGTADFDPGAGNFPMTAGNDNTGYFLELNSNGDFVRACSLTSTGSVISYDVYVDQSGLIYLAGIYTGTIDLDPGVGTDLHSSVELSGFVTKLDASGNFIWGKVTQASEPVIVYSVDVNAIGQVMLSGYMENTTDFNPDPLASFELTPSPNTAMGAFIAQLNANGEFVNAMGFAGCNIADYHGAYTDAAGNIFIAGAFEDTVDLNPEPAMELNIGVLDFRDNYLIKLKPLNASQNEWEQTLFSIYPNPATETILLNTHSEAFPTAYAIYTTVGQSVKAGTLTAGQQELNISDLPKGTYFIRVGEQAIPFVKN